uniref:Bm13387 n=1 Tax=Brugia malayi TaxID=6279 RepID=A0A1I9G0G3_BRUMA|nr:Bm13387 [Brugia malayi]
MSGRSNEANNLCDRTMLKAISLLGIGFMSIFLVGFLGVYHNSHSIKAAKFKITSKGSLNLFISFL